jgi:hypothetical protein
VELLRGLRTSLPGRKIASSLAAGTICLSLIVVGATLVAAQNRRMDPDQDEAQGESAGGNWLEFATEDKMTGGKKVRFELQANNSFREDPNYPPRVNLFCENGKLKVADFNPGVRLPPPNRPGFWGQPQLEVEVRIDDAHYYKGWNWAQWGRNFLSMDKGTVRGMIGAQIFNIAMPTRSGRQIAEFSPAGLDLERVRRACDLTPKRPSKD